MLTSEMTSRRVASSVAELIAGATSCEPLSHADGKSGARLERVVIHGEPFVLKRFDYASDWVLRVGGDVGVRAVALWENGLYDKVPGCIDHTVVGAARGLDGAALLMRDITPFLIPEDAPVTMVQHRGFLAHMAALHASFWGWQDTCGFTPLATAYSMFGRASMTYEASRAEPGGVPRIAVEGWAQLRSQSPDVADVIDPLLDDPWPLVSALATSPWTFLQGDWKMGNLGWHPDGRTILFDWDRPGAGPATFDLAWYLAVNCDRLPEPKESAIAAYRASLEVLDVDTDRWWDRQLALTLLGGFLQLGWSKTWPGQEAELEWWASRVREGKHYLRT